MQSFCYSCGMPIEGTSQGPTEHVCIYCVDEEGALRARAEIRQGLAQWLQEWQPNVSEAEALNRADHYMRAMPAWQE